MVVDFSEGKNHWQPSEKIVYYALCAYDVKYAKYIIYVLIFTLSTLNGFASQGTGFLAQSIGYHAQTGCRTLICFTALSFPHFLCARSGTSTFLLTAHV